MRLFCVSILGFWWKLSYYSLFRKLVGKTPNSLPNKWKFSRIQNGKFCLNNKQSVKEKNHYQLFPYYLILRVFFCWIFFWTYLLFYIRYIFGTWCYANTIFFSFYLKNYKNKMSYKKQWNYTYKFEIDKFSGFPFSFSFFKLEKEHLLWKMDIGSSVGAWKAISHSISPFADKETTITLIQFQTSRILICNIKPSSTLGKIAS